MGTEMSLQKGPKSAEIAAVRGNDSVQRGGAQKRRVRGGSARAQHKTRPKTGSNPKKKSRKSRGAVLVLPYKKSGDHKSLSLILNPVAVTTAARRRFHPVQHGGAGERM